MPTRALPLFGSRRSLRVLERNALVYRSQWLMLVSGFFEPLFYLLSIGIGLNHLVGDLSVNGRVVSYATFVAPGMLATTAMNGAMIDTIFNTFFKLKVSHAYDALLATPLDVADVALGAVWWALARATVYAASFILCMAILGDAGSVWVVLCWPGAILTSLTFSCIGLAACTYVRSWQDFDLVTLVQLPLFLFGDVFSDHSLSPMARRDCLVFALVPVGLTPSGSLPRAVRLDDGVPCGVLGGHRTRGATNRRPAFSPDPHPVRANTRGVVVLSVSRVLAPLA